MENPEDNFFGLQRHLQAGTLEGCGRLYHLCAAACGRPLPCLPASALLSSQLLRRQVSKYTKHGPSNIGARASTIRTGPLLIVRGTRVVLLRRWSTRAEQPQTCSTLAMYASSVAPKPNVCSARISIAALTWGAVATCRCKAWTGHSYLKMSRL